MVRHEPICFVIYANSLGRKFILLHFVLFENIKLLGQIILFTASEQSIMPVLCSWYAFMW